MFDLFALEMVTTLTLRFSVHLFTSTDLSILDGTSSACCIC